MPENTPDLDAFFGIRAPRLGLITEGALSRGLDVRLDAHTDIEGLAVGRYVVIRGKSQRYFCMVTDIGLASISPDVAMSPPQPGDDFLRDIHQGLLSFGTIHISPMLTINSSGDVGPVRTIPPHYQEVLTATAEDINDVFGKEDETHFYIGTPLELDDTRINVDLQRLTERSVGVFGKSGTGKSYLTRIILAGTIARNTAVNLIFDMHNDYGHEVKNESGNVDRGLRQLFPEKVALFTLDDESSRRRNARPDYVVRIPYNAIDPEDFVALRETLDLSDSMLDAAYTLNRIYGKDWIIKTLMLEGETFEELIATSSINAASLAALIRRMERLQRFDFLVADLEENAVETILTQILQGVNVVLEFGRYGNDLSAYILVANYITRRIRQHYVRLMEASLGDKSKEPPQLMITIEEAHKFLEPRIARQTIFGVIARELRKYRVTLLVVDQRPSAIDDEVMSQIGTRVTALLDNEKDINAVLTGINGAQGLREVLARLETKQQAIILGHAVPMPVVIQTRPYGEAFYASLGQLPEGGAVSEKRKASKKALYGE